ncbi:DUF309 domain-containing protein [Bacillus massiliglaciei]|uniref:DUF309 domain-containing protein n=1 Tax=Bacillus massiliglaciei TaxID=1816693 RepID=UPI000A7DEF67|nr:DUF309 domain-containing protein [Bacillus massiliglaciei]
MKYPEEYLSFMAHFHGSRDYFECHEILEEYWKETAPRDRHSHWVGLIQIAVGLYHQRRGNYKGASKTMDKAFHNLFKKKEEIQNLGLNHESLIELVRQVREEMSARKPYRSISLPIRDPELLEQCKERCRQLGAEWDTPSDLSDESIVQKHTVRDRTEIIQERNRQLQKRKSQNELT